MKILIIVNPMSGRGKAAKNISKLESLLKKKRSRLQNGPNL